MYPPLCYACSIHGYQLSNDLHSPHATLSQLKGSLDWATSTMNLYQISTHTQYGDHTRSGCSKEEWWRSLRQPAKWCPYCQGKFYPLCNWKISQYRELVTGNPRHPGGRIGISNIPATFHPHTLTAKISVGRIWDYQCHISQLTSKQGGLTDF